jgi:hypothetical protein
MNPTFKMSIITLGGLSTFGGMAVLLYQWYFTDTTTHRVLKVPRNRSSSSKT